MQAVCLEVTFKIRLINTTISFLSSGGRLSRNHRDYNDPLHHVSADAPRQTR